MDIMVYIDTEATGNQIRNLQNENLRPPLHPFRETIMIKRNFFWMNCSTLLS